LSWNGTVTSPDVAIDADNWRLIRGVIGAQDHIVVQLRQRAFRNSKELHPSALIFGILCNADGDQGVRQARARTISRRMIKARSKRCTTGSPS
jgi:hypothetical protein